MRYHRNAIQWVGFSVELVCNGFFRGDWPCKSSNKGQKDIFMKEIGACSWFTCWLRRRRSRLCRRRSRLCRRRSRLCRRRSRNINTIVLSKMATMSFQLLDTEAYILIFPNEEILALPSFFNDGLCYWLLMDLSIDSLRITDRNNAVKVVKVGISKPWMFLKSP